MGSAMADVFVSYAKTDRSLASKLVAMLVVALLQSETNKDSADPQHKNKRDSKLAEALAPI